MGQLGMLFLYWGLGMVLFSILTWLVGMHLIPAGTSVDNMGVAVEKAIKENQNPFWIRVIHLINMVCLFGVPAFLYSRSTNGKELIWMGFSNHFNITQVFLALMVMLSASIFSGAFKDISEQLIAGIPSLAQKAKSLEAAYDDAIRQIGHIRSMPDLLIGLFLLAFLPAFFEELFFRGTMQRLFERWWGKPILAIIVTSVIFSLLHFSITLFITRTLLGIALGWMFYTTRNIWVNIFAHFINNALALISLYKSSFQNKLTQPEEMQLRHDWWIVLLSLIALVFFLSRLKFFSEETVFTIQAAEEKEKTKYSREGDWAG
jgi:membrane protease YdiL (CAAX protease family)